jgi:hypothetical protein
MTFFIACVVICTGEYNILYRFKKNPTNHLVNYIRLQTDGRGFHLRRFIDCVKNVKNCTSLVILF